MTKSSEAGATSARTGTSAARIEVRDLTMAFGDFIVMRDLNFIVRRGDIFVVMGGSGCGKSTLLRHMIGLLEPARGEILYEGKSFTRASTEERQRMLRRFGVTYQSGALWSSMTLAGEYRPAARRVHRSERLGNSSNRETEARIGRAQGV